MTNYTDAELEALLDEPESDLVERKESFRGDVPNAVREAMCAFANDLPDHRRAGAIFIGARDDGTPSGLAITDELLRNLADMKTDGNTLPPPTLAVSKRLLKGAWMAVVTVEPSDTPPVRYRGRIHIRIGPRKGTATAQDERILSEKRRYRDIPFDAQPVPSVSLDRLNRRLFEEEYLPSAFAQDVLAANERTYQQRLAACKMIASADDPTATVLGILVIGVAPRDIMPGAYVQFLRINGTNWGDDIIDEEVIDGPVGQIIRRLDEKLAAHNRTSIDLKSGLTEIRAFQYPPAALAQITRNAVMHRAYEATNAPIRVYWFNDRIEVLNPGGPFGAVTAENFGKPGVTDYRNPNLAEAMRVLGFVQRFGFGIQLAQTELARNGNPPLRFEPTPAAVLCTIRARP